VPSNAIVVRLNSCASLTTNGFCAYKLFLQYCKTSIDKFLLVSTGIAVHIGRVLCTVCLGDCSSTTTEDNFWPKNKVNPLHEFYNDFTDLKLQYIRI